MATLLDGRLSSLLRIFSNMKVHALRKEYFDRVGQLRALGLPTKCLPRSLPKPYACRQSSRSIPAELCLTNPGTPKRDEDMRSAPRTEASRRIAQMFSRPWQLLPSSITYQALQAYSRQELGFIEQNLVDTRTHIATVCNASPREVFAQRVGRSHSTVGKIWGRWGRPKPCQLTNIVACRN